MSRADHSEQFAVTISILICSSYSKIQFQPVFPKMIGKGWIEKSYFIFALAENSYMELYFVILDIRIMPHCKILFFLYLKRKLTNNIARDSSMQLQRTDILQ